ncbi:hypothetical protein D3C71_754760 [compost metagenome]
MPALLVFFCPSDFPRQTPPPVGAELARDSGKSVDIIGEFQSAIASKLSSYRVLGSACQAFGKQLLNRLLSLAVALQQDDLPIKGQFAQANYPHLCPMFKPQPGLG